MHFEISREHAPLVGERRIEVVERKGLGHPDSICDAVAEAVSLALCRLYLERTGVVQHHNVDKVLLAAGRAEAAFGGGRVAVPMQIFLAGRATLDLGGDAIAIEPLVQETVRGWLRRNLHALDPDRHVEVSSLVRPGSRELVALFGRGAGAHQALANDTSCGVGYAPLSETEAVVLAVERALNSRTTREQDPALGEDVKVMAVRRGDEIGLTISCAMIDAALEDVAAYQKAKERAAEIALAAAQALTARPVSVGVNVGDDVAAGDLFLTVTGTSAEAGDDGQAGRGNRVNGLITPGRTMTIESVAGKNPVTHVGKLYNLVASEIAERIVAELAEVSSATCRLVSRIGSPVREPWLVEVGLVGEEPGPELRAEVERIAQERLGGTSEIAARMMRGELGIDRWPLHE